MGFFFKPGVGIDFFAFNKDSSNGIEFVEFGLLTKLV